MGEVANAVDSIVRSKVKPFLKEHGFKKKANAFWRNTDILCDVISVQLSQSNFGSSGEFTINLGIYWHQIENLLGNKLRIFPPKEYECMMRERLGVLVSGGFDYWWDVNQDTDLNVLGDEIVEALSGHGLAWLRANHESENFLEYAGKRRQYLHAAAWSVLHNDEKAARGFVRMELKDKPLARQWVEERAKHLGIDYEVEE